MPPSSCRDSKPPLILLHGFAQQASSWNRVTDLLGEDRFVYTFEWAGHGARGESLPEEHDLDMQASALLAFVREVADRHAVAPVLVGYSMGGRIAAAMVHLAEPENVPISALVLESAGLGPVSNAERESARQRNLGWAQRLREQGLSSFMDYWEQLKLFESQRALSDEARQAVRAARMANDAEQLALSLERAGVHAMPNCRAALMRLAQRIPVAYVAGELDEKYASIARQLQASAMQVDECTAAGACDSTGMASMRLVALIVQGVGHNVHLEDPEAFVEIIR